MSIKSWIKRQVKKVIRRPQAPVITTPPTSMHQGNAPHTVADVVEHYDRYTADYCEVYGNVIQAGRTADIEVLLTHEFQGACIEDGQHVLDAGCGICGPSIWLAKRKQVTIDAVTISPPQLEIGRKAVEDAHLSDRIKIHLADYHKLEEVFPENTFDCVYFLESMGHAQSYPKAIASTYKVLKPGGCIYIKEYSERDFRNDPEKKERSKEFLKKVYTEYCYTMVHRQEMAAMLQGVGFKIEFEQAFPYVGDKEDLSVQINFEKKVGFHWRDGLDFWLPELMEVRARKPRT